MHWWLGARDASLSPQGSVHAGKDPAVSERNPQPELMLYLNLETRTSSNILINAQVGPIKLEFQSYFPR